MVVASFWLHDILHPLRGLGYQFWSGIAGCFITGSILTGVVAHFRAKNCHAEGCWRLGRFPVEGTPFVTCHVHHPHPEVAGRSVHVSKIHALHAAAIAEATPVRRGE